MPEQPISGPIKIPVILISAQDNVKIPSMPLTAVPTEHLDRLEMIVEMARQITEMYFVLQDDKKSIEVKSRTGESLFGSMSEMRALGGWASSG